MKPMIIEGSSLEDKSNIVVGVVGDIEDYTRSGEVVMNSPRDKRQIVSTELLSMEQTKQQSVQ